MRKRGRRKRERSGRTRRKRNGKEQGMGEGTRRLRGNKGRTNIITLNLGEKGRRKFKERGKRKRKEVERGRRGRGTDGGGEEK